MPRVGAPFFTRFGPPQSRQRSWSLYFKSRSADGNASRIFLCRPLWIGDAPDGTCMDLWDSGCGQGANVYLCGSNPTQQLQALVTSVQAWGDERASAHWTLQTLKLNIFQFLPTRPRKWDAKKLLDSAPEKPPEDPNNWHPEVLQMQRDAHKPDLSRGPQNRQVWKTSCWGSENDCPKNLGIHYLEESSE